MIVRHLLEAARAAGLSITVDGGDLLVECRGRPSGALISELRDHKPEVMEILRADEAASAATSRQSWWPERRIRAL